MLQLANYSCKSGQKRKFGQYFQLSVIPIWLDPLPGWTDNINGPTGLLIAAGKGVLRSMYCNKNSYADFVPADIAANSLLLVIGDFYRTQG